MQGVSYVLLQNTIKQTNKQTIMIMRRRRRRRRMGRQIKIE
jgi:hypothetical protein